MNNARWKTKNRGKLNTTRFKRYRLWCECCKPNRDRICVHKFVNQILFREQVFSDGGFPGSVRSCKDDDTRFGH